MFHFRWPTVLRVIEKRFGRGLFLPASVNANVTLALCCLAPLASLLFCLSLPALARADTFTPCFQMFAAVPDTLPGSPMLLNKCTGDTYVLSRVRHRKKSRVRTVYQWVPIAIGERHAQPVPQVSGGENCFKFNGRRFCQ
jgi:hypothetical protein